MASPFQAFLEDFAYPEGSDFSELDSEQTEVIQIELPDMEETQIMQNKDESVSHSETKHVLIFAVEHIFERSINLQQFHLHFF